MDAYRARLNPRERPTVPEKPSESSGSPPEPTSIAPPVPVLSRAAIGLLSGVVGAVSALVLVLAVLETPKPVWVLVGSELMAIVAAVFGVLLGLGKFRDAPAFAAACAGGCFLIASAMAWIGAYPARSVASVSIEPWIFARVGAGLAILAIGCWLVLARDRAAMRLAIRGIALGAPVLIVVALIVTGRAKPAFTALGSLPGAFRALVAIIVFLILAGLFAASVDTLVKAFAKGQIRARGRA